MRVSATALCALLMATGCGGDEDIYKNLPESTGNDAVTATVTREGASLALASGSRVRIPEDALREPVEIGVRELETAAVPARPADTGSLETPVAMTPHGTRFEKPVRVDLPIQRADGELEQMSVRVLRLENDVDETWEELDVPVKLVKDDEGRQRAEFDIETFSIYSLAISSAGPSDVPEGDGGGATSSTGGTFDSTGSTMSGTGSVAPAATQTFSISVLDVVDPCGHREFTGDPPPTIDVTTGDGTFEATGDSPFVPVTGTLSSDGTFDATGFGTVAGTPEVSVSMTGTLSADGLLDAQLSWGNNMELGDGCPIVFTLQGR